MKRNIQILSCLAVMVIMNIFAMTVDAFAQQALWSGAKVTSPEVNNDNSVTFRYSAPNVIRVQVTGDFLRLKQSARLTAFLRFRESPS